MTEIAVADTGTQLPSIKKSGSSSRVRVMLMTLTRRLVQLVVLLFTISTVLFFLLRVSGDPASILAGENADPEFLAKVRAHYGLDQPLVMQYLNFLLNAFRLDFGSSIQSGGNALGLVLERLPSTMQLASLGILINLLVAVPVGAWLGAKPSRVPRGIATGLLFIGQGIPGYVVGLILIQVFAIWLKWFPSFGASAGVRSMVLPASTLAAFLIPRLTRVLAANVRTAMGEDYVRTARAFGASKRVVVLQHALPNALLGAAALVGGQFAFLLSGALITEVIFAWPGLGRLLIDSVLVLDFPVVQAAVFVVAFLVFIVNVMMDSVFTLLDPRLRRQRA